jgi:hypothetical protein
MKRKRIDTEKLSEMVKDRLLGDGGLIPEHRINRIIKDYLSERNEFLDDDTPIKDKYEFTPRTQKAFEDMSDGLEEMIGDLEVIKQRESDVLVEVDVYADEYITNMLSNLEAVKEDLLFLKNLSENNDDYDGDFIDDEEPLN